LPEEAAIMIARECRLCFFTLMQHTLSRTGDNPGDTPATVLILGKFYLLAVMYILQC